MPSTRHRLVPWAFAATLLAWVLAETATGGHAGLLYIAPALVLALPLALGRYVAEDRLVELAARPSKRRLRPLRLPTPHSRPRVMARGGCLVARAMAKRPPPPGASRPIPV
jgi:hypothetical protein